MTLRIFSRPPEASLSTSLLVTRFSAARTTPARTVLLVLASAAVGEAGLSVEAGLPVEVDAAAEASVIWASSVAGSPPMTADVFSPFSAWAKSDRHRNPDHHVANALWQGLQPRTCLARECLQRSPRAGASSVCEQLEDEGSGTHADTLHGILDLSHELSRCSCSHGDAHSPGRVAPLARR